MGQREYPPKFLGCRIDTFVLLIKNQAENLYNLPGLLGL